MALPLTILTDEELQRYCVLSARESVAASGSPHMTVEEAVTAQLEAWHYVRVLRERHEIPEDVDIQINVSTGVVSEHYD